MTVDGPGSTTLEFLAERTPDTTLAGLMGSLAQDESVLSSWDFTVTGIPADAETMLSYAVTGMGVIPEPAAILLSGLASCLVLARRPRRRG